MPGYAWVADPICDSASEALAQLMEKAGWLVKRALVQPPSVGRDTACSWAAVEAAVWFLTADPISWPQQPQWVPPFTVPKPAQRIAMMRQTLPWLEEKQGCRCLPLKRAEEELKKAVGSGAAAGGHCLSEAGMRAVVGARLGRTHAMAFEVGNAVDGGFRALVMQLGCYMICHFFCVE